MQLVKGSGGFTIMSPNVNIANYTYNVIHHSHNPGDWEATLNMRSESHSILATLRIRLILNLCAGSFYKL